MVDPSRLVPIEDISVSFADCGFLGRRELVINDEAVFVTDPTYLANVFNSNDDPAAVYLWRNGVFVFDFGGDTNGPIWWKDPYVVVAISSHYGDMRAQMLRPSASGPRLVIPELAPLFGDHLLDQPEIDLKPPSATELCHEVGCDSGSFVFVPITVEIPDRLFLKMRSVLQQRNGAELRLPSGTYQFYYQQFDPPPTSPNSEAYYRNIVAVRT